MDYMQEFLGEIEGFLERTGMKPGTFGHQAVNEGKFVRRIRNGHQVLPRTAERARKFMADYMARADRSGD